MVVYKKWLEEKDNKNYSWKEKTKAVSKKDSEIFKKRRLKAKQKKCIKKKKQSLWRKKTRTSGITAKKTIEKNNNRIKKL